MGFQFFISWRVAMGTYPVSRPAGGVTIRAWSRLASFPVAGGARYSRSDFQFQWIRSTRACTTW
jgi:hypothetical protein